MRHYSGGEGDDDAMGEGDGDDDDDFHHVFIAQHRDK